MIAAAASSPNAACGRDAQLNIWIGRTVKWSRGPLGVKGDERQRTDHYQGRGLADGPRQGENDAGQNARQRDGQHLMED